jgi:outer membrane lipoprotein LolB
MGRRVALGFMGSLSVLVLAGCASFQDVPPALQGGGHWSGRLALRVERTARAQAQSYTAVFDLRGDADTGELRLSTSLGSMLALARWSPQQAMLDDGRNGHYFNSVNALIEAATGAAIPIESLFAWLAGQPGAAPGWRADLRQIGQGRLHAVRESPAPGVDLRIVLDP